MQLFLDSPENYAKFFLLALLCFSKKIDSLLRLGYFKHRDESELLIEMLGLNIIYKIL